MRTLSTLRCLLPLIAVAMFLTACGGSGATPTSPFPPPPTIAPTPTGPRPIPTPPPTLDPSHIRTGSAIIPSPVGQTASIVPSTIATPGQNPPPGVIPPTVPLPTATSGIVLTALQGGNTYTMKDSKTSIRYPSDWDAQTADNAAQFMTKGASPSDPNVPRVTFNSFPVDLDLLTSDNARSYVQTLAQQTAARGSTDLTVRSIDRVRLGGPTGPEAVRVVVAYTAGVAVISEQVIVKRPNMDETYFISATAPAATYDAKWKPIIDGIAGSVIFP